MTIACSHCGTLQDLDGLPRGASASCLTCASPLERTRGRSIAAALACASATTLLLFPANLLPLMQVSMLGMTRQSRIMSGIAALWGHQWVIVAALVCGFVVVAPLARYLLLSIVLGHVLLGRRRQWLGSAFRWVQRLDPWAMPEVYLIGCAIGWSRVEVNLPVQIGWGGYTFMAAAFLAMISRAVLDRRTVWRALSPERTLPPQGMPVISCTVCDLVIDAQCDGQRCPRCGARLRARRAHAVLYSSALVLAALLLYIPANLYPMSTDVQLGQLVPHRIVDGIRELFAAGLWPLGVLIFCTSIAIPLLKIAGIGWCVLSIHARSSRALRLKTRLYRLIDEIGRWSSVDVFTIAVFVPLLQFGALASARAASGAPAFILVVVLTMLASQVFDPRLMWDVAQAPLS
ncbi:MAG TPA: paraquat-inducible protein A [Steroidobacteraceae bacterium]|nr:paraquat-inducible protein A [Steroidobacteraceae bacterium]